MKGVAGLHVLVALCCVLAVVVSAAQHDYREMAMAAAEHFRGKPDMQRKLLSGDYTELNRVLGALELVFDLGALGEKPLVVRNVKTVAIIDVTLTFYFLDPRATCKNIRITDDIVLEGRKGLKSVDWRENQEGDDFSDCEIRGESPCTEENVKKDARDESGIVNETCGLRYWEFVSPENGYKEVALKSDDTRGCGPFRYTEKFGDRRVEEYIYSVLIKGVYLECRVEKVRVTHNVRDISAGTPNEEENLAGRPDGSLDLRGSFGGQIELFSTAKDFFDKTTPQRTKRVPGSCPGNVFQFLNDDPVFEFNDLGGVEVNLGVTEINIQDLDDDVNAEINGAQKGVALDPINDVLCEVFLDITDQFAKLIDDFSLDGDYDIPLPNGRLDEYRALQFEREYVATPGVSLVDIGDNVASNLVGIFPDDSKFLSGDDDDADSPLEPLYDFIINETVVIYDNLTDPVLAIVDTFAGTDLASSAPDAPKQVDIVAAVTTFLGEENDLVTQDGLEFVFGFEVVEGKGQAVNITLKASKLILDIFPRQDRTRFQRNWLDRIELLGPQTLRVPSIEGFDFNLTVEMDIKLEFFGGEYLIEGNVQDAEAGSGDAILGSLAAASFSDSFDVSLFWENFYAEAAAIVPIDELAVRALPIGPLASNISDCLLSTFYKQPFIGDLALDTFGTDLFISEGAQGDGFLGIVTSAATMILPMFRGLIASFAMEAGREALMSSPLLDATTCAKPVNKGDDVLFAFEGGFMDQIRELVTEENVQALLNAVFPRGTTPETRDWNQLISEPIDVWSYEDLPSANGLNVEFQFRIMNLELGGINPANFTSFNFLTFNQTLPPGNPDRPYSLYTDLGIGIPTNPLRFAIELQVNAIPDRSFGRRRRLSSNLGQVDERAEDERFLGPFTTTFNPTSAPVTPLPTRSPTAFPTRSPTPRQPSTSPTTSPTPRPSKAPTTGAPTPYPYGTQVNHVRLEASFENVFFLLDLLLKFRDFDIISTPLEEVLSIWCWFGKLIPYGGVKGVKLNVTQGLMSFECIECMNDVMRGLEERFRNPEASNGFFELVNEVLDILAQILVDFFDLEKWERSISDMQRWCQGLDSLESDQQFESLVEDLSGVYAFLGLTTLVLGGLAFTNCACLNSTHVHGPVGGHGKKSNKEKKDLHSFLDDMDDLDHIKYELENTPLYKHPGVPAVWRVLIPSAFFINLTLFIIGHVGQAVTTSLYASVAGVPVELEDFQSISVIQSAEAVWNSGGYFLALLIIILSIVWPYAKIIGMMYCWFAPTSMIGFHARGTLIKRLDQLGKWSLIELYLLLFILVTFRLSVASPELTWLPEGFYNLRLGIDPQLSIYTFCTALVFSLATSNILEWWHEHIEKKVATVHRPDHPSDQTRMSAMDFRFPTGNGSYTLGISRTGAFMLVVGCILAIALKLVAASLPVLRTEIVGLARLILELEEAPNVTDYSLFKFFFIIFGSGSIGEAYLGMFFALTVIAIPVLQLVMLIGMLIGRFSLDSAIFWYDINVVVSAWACSEVFIMGVGVTVMELGQISGNLVKRECAFLQPLMENQLQQVGLVDEIDVKASCYTLLGSIREGLYVLFVAMVIANICHYSITVGFLRMVQARLDLREGQRRYGYAETGVERFLVSCLCMNRGEPKSYASPSMALAPAVPKKTKAKKTKKGKGKATPVQEDIESGPSSLPEPTQTVSLKLFGNKGGASNPLYDQSGKDGGQVRDSFF